MRCNVYRIGRCVVYLDVIDTPQFHLCYKYVLNLRTRQTILYNTLLTMFKIRNKIVPQYLYSLLVNVKIII
jgi:hypothetical protein